MTSSTPRTPAPERPPPPVLPPPIEPPPPDPSPSPPGEEFHTPTPSFEASPQGGDGSANIDGTAIAKSPQLSPVRFPSPSRLPAPGSPAASNGQEEGRAATPSPARQQARPPLRLATGLVRTPSQGSVAAKSPSSSSLSTPSPMTPASVAKSPSPSPTPPSPLTPAPAAKPPSPSLSPPSPLTPAHLAKPPSPSPSLQAPSPAAKSPFPSPQALAHPPAVDSSIKSTPKRAEAWKPSPPVTPAAIAVPLDPDEEAATSPLQVGKARFDQQRRTPGAAENGGEVPSEVAAVARVGERRQLSVALRLATAVLSLAAFSVMVSARTSGWAGDYYGRHQQYRYAVGVNVVVCAYSIAQSIGEIRRLITSFIYRSMSSYYVSLFLDQALAYLLMSASSAAGSRNDLWVSRFGTDPFNRKISSAVWLSLIAFLMLALNALISTANLFSMV